MLASPLITILIGIQILGISNDIPLTWLNTFKQYPYLYKGTPEEAQQYFEYFASNAQGLVVHAKVDDNLAGFITGVPLLANERFKGISSLFQTTNLDPTLSYYLSDAIVLASYRNKGVAKNLFRLLEEKVRSWGYKNICLATSEREENHPLKPSNYTNSDEVWKHLGYTKTSMKINHEWITIIDEKENAELRENVLVFWIKELQ